MTTEANTPLRVLIAGGGVAGLETVAALRELAGDAVDLALLAPEPDFVYRPMRVGEPFALTLAESVPLDVLASEWSLALHRDALAWVDPAARVVHTEQGAELGYDILVLALGARRSAALSHGITIDDAQLDEQLHGLVQDIEAGYVHSVAFVVPDTHCWPLPAYELALLSTRSAYDACLPLQVTVITSEHQPLGVFGPAASAAITDELERNGIELISGAHVQAPERGQLILHPGDRELRPERIIALPLLSGAATPGIPKDAASGFIAVDAYCAVRGLDDVYAVGDLTDMPVKFGALAAQQADTAAAAIAARAGAPVRPEPLRAVLRAMLLGTDEPLYLEADLTGGTGSHSRVSSQAGAPLRGMVAARYLNAYLDAREARGAGLPAAQR